MSRGGGMGGGPPQDAPTGRERPNPMQGLDRLVIFHEGDEFNVTDSQDIMMSVRTDGGRTERWTPRGQEFVSASETAKGLVVRSEMESGPSRSTVYALDDDGRLVVVHTLRPPRADKSIELKMVYDRTE